MPRLRPWESPFDLERAAEGNGHASRLKLGYAWVYTGAESGEGMSMPSCVSNDL